MERYQIVKAGMCFQGLLSKNSQKFDPVLQNTNWRLAERSAAYDQDKNYQKMELNTSDVFMNLRTKDFLVGQCHSNIYTL